jgi:hypothetical protein
LGAIAQLRGCSQDSNMPGLCKRVLADAGYGKHQRLLFAPVFGWHAYDSGTGRFNRPIICSRVVVSLPLHFADVAMLIADVDMLIKAVAIDMGMGNGRYTLQEREQGKQ